MRFEINVRPLAYSDIVRIVRCIASTVSSASATKWQDGIYAKIDSLKLLPERSPLADEAETLDFDLRMMLYGRGRQIYRVLFTIDDHTVNVLRVRHAAQDWVTAEDF